MDDKVNVECPNCGYIITLSLSDLKPGMSCECLNCYQIIRFTDQDIRHLMEAIRQRR
jgi:hypothetical protein